jgi:hypothetical protein
MNENRSLEDQLEAVGTALRRRPTITDRVMVDVREVAADGSTEEPVHEKPRVRLWRRRITATAAAVVAMVATAVGVLLMLTPAPSVGWAQMVEALQTQRWIRGKVTFSSGREGTMWLSPQRQIWAYKLESVSRFYDGRERVKYEHHPRENAITKLPLGEEDAQRVLPVEALSRDESAIGPWLFGERIIHQERHEVVEDGKNWIEFKLTRWRGDANQASLRVDPETRLPVYLLLVSPTGEVPPIKWEFDYPDDGPTDIYALGVPRETKIDDQMPNDDVIAALDTIAASRALLGDFRLTVGDRADNRTFIVSRKGDRWRIDVYHGPHSLMRDDDDEEIHLSVNEWLAERIEQSEPRPLYVCDGTTVLKNENSRGTKPDAPFWVPQGHMAPQDLLTCRTSYDDGLSLAPYVCLTKMVYPDLTPVNWMDFEFVSQPDDAPDWVLIKRSAYTTMGNHAHEWFYLDPAKGHAVTRVELLSVPNGTDADLNSTTQRNTYRMEKFLQSRRGFWYPTIVHFEMSNYNHTIRYRYEFDVDLPNSLFEIPDATPVED